MRRKWGRGFQFNFPKNADFPKVQLPKMQLPKPLPRRWGKRFPFFGGGNGGSPIRPVPRKWGSGFSSIRIGSGVSPRPVPRKWGTRRRFSFKAGGDSGPAKRWTPKRQRSKMKRRHVWLIALLIVLFLIIQGAIFLDRELRQPLMFLAKIKVNQLATNAINDAIKSELAQALDSDKLIRWRTNADGKITGFEVDYKQQMAITARTIEVVERSLQEHEEVPERIPIGHVLNSPIISSIGPSVSIKFRPASVVKVEVETEQKEAGINNLLVEVYARIRTEVAVIIPFDREPEVIETKIPLSYALVVGDVPTYYYDGSGTPVGSGASQAPAIALPGNPPPQTKLPAANEGKGD
ncbi:sporulation protein YunB [Cohnella terricola]|uniref:Sporulation protein YunB n=1 Tax=Cohnella terricola TaxID=1289167 RepID=A0A559JFQ5_9BACL|nr:sporulation protein YunB [Cohnella terricola]TVX98705.1 sporulation protein YunB [Cohnella terricola]